ncbi:MAG: GC-type dockerin domain-anchored protein [Phycisphaerales bacterium]
MRPTRPVLLTACLLVTPAFADSPTPPSGSSWGILLSDYSGDGRVDAADFLLWRHSLGDFNRDGVVDASDFTVWRDNFLNDSGAPINGFNGCEHKVSEVELAWRSVPLRPMFPSDSAYSAWLAPLAGGAGLAGDFNADGLVDAADFAVWRSALVGATDSLPAFMFAAGDMDNSGSVDADDLDVWQANFGMPDSNNTPSGVLPGDFNNDGGVDAADYAVWRDNLGSSALPSGTTHAGNDWWWGIDADAGACLADQTGDGALNLDDLDAFVARFLAGDLAADATADGALNLDDVDAFVAAFLAGCG